MRIKAWIAFLRRLKGDRHEAEEGRTEFGEQGEILTDVTIDFIPPRFSDVLTVALVAAVAQN